MLFHLYKLGRSAESAIPMIMFFCEENEPRKMAKKAIDEEGLPRKLLGFRTGHLARIPDAGKSIQSAAERERLQQANEPGLVSEVYLDHYILSRPSGCPYSPTTATMFCGKLQPMLSSTEENKPTSLSLT
jgi:hypothetical protein